MAYKLSSSIWNAMFAIPTGIADDHLKKVSGQQLKVILYLLRHNGDALSATQLAEGVGLSEADAKDAMQYWIAEGYVYEEGTTPKPMNVSATAPILPATQKVLVEVPDVLPTHEQIASRTLEDPIIAGLFNEVQLKLGKTIGYDTQAKLLMMIDAYGLPPEVILTIVEYAVAHEKTAISYICKVGKNWAENGIDSLEKAEERLKQLDATEKMWKEFTSNFSVDPPKYTDKRCALLRKWRQDYKQSNELICYAYEEMINNINKVQFNYLDKILESWHTQGLTTPRKVIDAKKTTIPGAGTGKSGATTTKTTSYDSGAYQKKARGPIEYKRKED